MKKLYLVLMLFSIAVISILLSSCDVIAGMSNQKNGLDIDIPPSTGMPYIAVPIANSYLSSIEAKRFPDLPLVLPIKGVYQAGDEISFVIETGIEAADIEVDFSALDSNYQPQNTQIKDLGRGRYDVKYRIITKNIHQNNEYNLPLIIRKKGVEKSANSAINITYYPKGVGSIQFPEGRFISKRWPELQEAEVKLSSVRIEKKSSHSNDFTLQQSTNLRVEFVGDKEIANRNLELEIREPEKDGYWQVPLQLSRKTCREKVCTYTSSISIGSNISVAHSFDLQLRIISGQTASQAVFLPNQNFTSLPFERTHKVSGRIYSRYVRREPNEAASEGNPDYPQYAEVQSDIFIHPVRWAKIVLEDDCGSYIKGVTDSQGNFSFDWTPVNCWLGKITVWSVVESGQREAAVGSWKGNPVHDLNDLTNRTSDYQAYSFSESFFVSAADLNKDSEGLNLEITIPETNIAAKAFFILHNVIDAQDYYHDIPIPNSLFPSLPKINVEYTSGLKPESVDGDNWDGRYATYKPNIDAGFIHIPQEPFDYSWNQFSHIHETSHYFTRHYLRNHDYGKIDEPLANAQTLAILGTHWFDKLTEERFENIDVQANFEDGAFRQADWNFCNGSECELDYSYGWVQRVLWDLIDGDFSSEPESLTSYISNDTNTEEEFGLFDHFDGGGGHFQSTDADDHKLNDVLINYLGGGIEGTQSPDYEDRGLPNVDIVDVLDGMLCRGHMSEADVNLIVNFAMDFGYEPDDSLECN